VNSLARRTYRDGKWQITWRQLALGVRIDATAADETAAPRGDMPY